MGKTKEDKGTQSSQFPGVSPEIFKAAVQAIVELRDNGKYLIFLGRRSSVRIIGNEHDFFSALTEQEGFQEIDEEQTKDALQEIRKYARAYGTTLNEKNMVNFLTRAVYDDEYDSFNEEGKEAFRNRVEEKVRLIKEYIYTDAFRERSQRFDTSIIPCLEDVEYELVKERRIALTGQSFEGPFLRLGLRHSKGESESSPFFGKFITSMLWSKVHLEGLSSFEFECDESDIDLLLLRLSEAKEFLLSAREPKDQK